MPRTNMLTCKFEDGNGASLRHVVVDTLVLKNNQILLVKRALHLTNGGKFGLVGGFVDRDETLEEAVRREVLEETGYKVKVERMLRIKDSPKRRGEDRQNISFSFIATSLEKVGEADDESTEVTWFDLDKLPPEDQFAFDHYEDIQLYLKTGKNK